MRKGVPSFNNYGKEKEPVESPAELEITGSGSITGIIVNSNFVSVYDSPSDVAKTLDYVAKDEEVEIIGKENGFYKVRYGRFNRIGYVSFNFCKGVW